MMIRRSLLPVIVLFLVACSPVIKLRAVSPTDTAQAVVTPTRTQVAPSPTPQLAQVKASQSLNVRVRPGEHQPVIGALYTGDKITLTGSCRSGWAQIVWKDRAAWVNAAYLSRNKCQK